MNELFEILIVLGMFFSFSFGLCLTYSIEAKECKLTKNIYLTLTLSGLVSFLIGLIGVFILNFL